MPGVNGESAIAEEIICSVCGRHRADERPRTGCGVELPHVTAGPVKWPGAVAISDVQKTVRRKYAMVRQKAGRLTGNGGPCCTAVCSAENTVPFVRDACIDGLSGAARCAASGIKDFPHDSVGITEINVASLLYISSDGSEAGYFVPGSTEVRALPQTIAAARTKQQSAVQVGINHQTLAHRASGHVAAEFEGQVGTLKRVALIGGAQNRAIGSCKRVGVRAGRYITACGIDRVRRDALNTQSVPVVKAYKIHQRNPALVDGVPSIGSADIGPRIDEVLLAGIENDSGNKAAATAGISVVPRIGLRECGYRQQREQKQRKDCQRCRGWEQNLAAVDQDAAAGIRSFRFIHRSFPFLGRFR